MVLKRAIMLAAAVALAPAAILAAERATAKATVAGKKVAIEYGRPTLQGRDMLGQAQVGTPWRMGADADTTLTTDADLSFGTVQVPKGTYVLRAAKIGEDTWQLNVLSSAREKVAEVPLASSALPESVEMFTIELKGEKDKGDFEMRWGKKALRASFTAK